MIRSTLIFFLATISLSSFAGGMSDIHMQTRQTVFYHFHERGENVLSIRDINFTAGSDVCALRTQARVLVYGGDNGKRELHCKVCFREKSERNFVAKGASCE